MVPVIFSLCQLVKGYVEVALLPKYCSQLALEEFSEGFAVIGK